MVRKISILVTGLVLAFTLVLGGWGCSKPATAPAPAPKPAPAPAPAPAPPPKVIKWKFQNTQGPTSYAAVYYFGPFAKMVNERSGGRLEIEVMAPNAIVSDEQAFSAAAKGIIQAAGNVGAKSIPSLREAAVEFGLPANLETLDQFYEFVYQYKGGAFLSTLDEAYREKGVRLLSLGGFRNGLQTKFPVNKIDDLKGKKLFASGVTGKMIAAVGASVVSFSPIELYEALQRGTIDGAAFTIYGTKTYNLMEVTSHIILPPLSINSLSITASLDAYNQLPDDLKKVVEVAALEAAQKSFRPMLLDAEEADVKLAQTKGVKVLTLPAAEFDRIRKVSLPFWDQTAAETPRSAKLVDLLKSYLKEK